VQNGHSFVCDVLGVIRPVFGATAAEDGTTKRRRQTARRGQGVFDEALPTSIPTCPLRLTH